MLVSLVFGSTAVSLADSPLALSEGNVRLMEQCEAVFDGSTLVVTDTDDNNDVWSSKLLVNAGMAGQGRTGPDGAGQAPGERGSGADSRGAVHHQLQPH